MMKIEELQRIVSATTYRIIVDPIEVQEESENGIRFTKDTIEAQAYLRYYGQVISIGPNAFNDDKFLNAEGVRVEPCKVGDWIVYGRHAGIDICVRDGNQVRRMRAINDDQVIAQIHDIEKVKIPLV